MSEPEETKVFEKQYRRAFSKELQKFIHEFVGVELKGTDYRIMASAVKIVPKMAEKKKNDEDEKKKEEERKEEEKGEKKAACARCHDQHEKCVWIGAAKCELCEKRNHACESRLSKL